MDCFTFTQVHHRYFLSIVSPYQMHPLSQYFMSFRNCSNSSIFQTVGICTKLDSTGPLGSMTETELKVFSIPVPIPCCACLVFKYFT